MTDSKVLTCHRIQFKLATCHGETLALNADRVSLQRCNTTFINRWKICHKDGKCCQQKVFAKPNRQQLTSNSQHSATNCFCDKIRQVTRVPNRWGGKVGVACLCCTNGSLKDCHSANAAAPRQS